MLYDTLARPFLRPLLAMVLALAAGLVSSGALWWLLATLLPLLYRLAVSVGKWLFIVSVGLVLTFFILDVLVKEDAALDTTLDSLGAAVGRVTTAAAHTHDWLCFAWKRMPAALCPARALETRSR